MTKEIDKSCDNCIGYGCDSCNKYMSAWYPNEETTRNQTIDEVIDMVANRSKAGVLNQLIIIREIEDMKY